MERILVACYMLICLTSLTTGTSTLAPTTTEPDFPAPPSTPPTHGCFFDNQFYPEGLIKETPCESYYCDGYGQIIVGCTFCPSKPLCVDWYEDPNECCKQCPTGPNCYYTDGVTIIYGPTGMPDGSVCYCSVSESEGSSLVCSEPQFPITPAPYEY